MTLAAGLLVSFSSAGSGQVVNPTPFFCSYYDNATTYNGQLVKPGTIITAYDNNGVLCGYFEVHTEGAYGFMPVYGDDNTSTTDEGAKEGEPITFRINGRLATVVNGDATWSNQANKQVRLTATSNVAFFVLSVPEDRAVNFNDTVRFDVVLRNEGNGIDFYGVRATADNPNFRTLPQSDTVYADPSEVVTVSFFIETPLFLGGGDTVITVNYSVYSIVDTTVAVDSSVLLYFTITDVDEGDGALPVGFALHQNYPNPFNPRTNIAFSLPVASQTSIEIYNVIGQLIEFMDLGNLGAGEHSVQWDALTHPSGVYFYRLTSNGLHQTKKMVLMK